jgi:hypothetical protein
MFGLLSEQWQKSLSTHPANLTCLGNWGHLKSLVRAILSRQVQRSESSLSMGPCRTAIDEKQRLFTRLSTQALRSHVAFPKFSSDSSPQPRSDSGSSASIEPMAGLGWAPWNPRKNWVW